MEKTSAPALQRGIQILQALEKHGAQSLDEITQRVPIPKSSALRFLETLTDMDLVSRDNGNRTYKARVVLVPVWQGEAHMTAKRQKEMESLAARTNRTVEWYVVGNTGLVMVERAEPERTEVRIGATTGFNRTWNDELEAVSCLGYGWAGGAPRPTKLWAYVEDGARGKLPLKRAKERIAMARDQGLVRDTVYNSNGVRRLATVVVSDGVLAGVLALSEHESQVDSKKDAELPALLRATAEKLSDAPLPPLASQLVSATGK